MTDKYNPQEIEQKWQKIWEDENLYRVKEDSAGPKWYALTMFPYTSGDLHIGHWYAMAPSDVYARFKRLQGFNVLHPMGFDAFGLPAENAAIKKGIHPRAWTYQNIDNMRKQLKSMGSMYDWSREVITCDPEYYKWTQWFFVKLFEHDLAYRSKSPVNWCPKCQVVLANEQVENGLCWRCETPVVKRDLEQWLFRITRYADELMEHKDIDWPERIRIMQRNWVGKSYGTEISFGLDHHSTAEKEIKVFTTRPDTVFGVTFMVLAPENPLVAKITTPDKKAGVDAYVARTRRFTDIERLSTEKEKDGVFTGAYVTNRLTGDKVPVWIADYVLASYGTGAVMAVPAHDERDFAFALKYGIPIIPVIAPVDGITKSFAFPNTMKQGFEEELKKGGFDYTPAKTGGQYIILHGEAQIEKYIKLVKTYLKPDNWNDITGTPWLFFFAGKSGIETIALDSIASEAEILKRCRKIEPNVRNCRTVVEMLNNCEFYRDRLFHAEHGRMIHSGQFNGNMDGIKAVTEYLEKKHWGKGTVSYRMRDWLISRQRYWGAPIPMIYCPQCGIVAVPEKDLPVLLPEEAEFRPTGESPLKYNEKFVNTTCPKCGGPAKRETDTIDGFLCSCWYFLRYCSPHDSKAPFDPEQMKYWMPVDIYTGGAEHAVMHLLYARFFTKAIRDMGLVDFGEPFKKLFNQGIIVADHQKMSKSKGNVVNPDAYVNELGADTVRAYMMFLGPWEQGGEWFDTGISGVARWLNRVWNIVLEEYEPQTIAAQAAKELERFTHQTIKKVTIDMDRLRLNTMIAALMEYTNYMNKVKESANVSPKDWHNSVEALIVMIAPTAPHLAEELWHRSGHKDSVHNQKWPVWDEELAKEDEITLVVQVNGKLRDRPTVPASITEEEAKKIAQASEKVQPFIQGKTIVNVIYVPGKLVNIVVK